ncbi:ATP-binding protein [candidate division WOR-3 bacterium]|nr:ATP-binding protein [candidate division WOR-3 bacterium]
MKDFFEKAAMQNHPLRVLQEFLKQEKDNEQAKRYDAMRFVGYVLEIGYDTVTIITSDPFKIAVGGVPRNSLLIMVPANYDTLPAHFTLLRVLEAAPTPLTKEVQQTYFELQKKSMPELDVFTQSELQWGALKSAVLGMFYPHPEKSDAIEFSGDLSNFVSAHKYRVYAPNDELLNLMINSMVPKDNRFLLGELRLTECRLPLPNKPLPKVPVYVSARDFMGTRTAMFGKTRLGKSNVVKLIAQSLIETTKKTKNVGQLIFDINGEYANDNPQDNSFSLRSAYHDRCVVYALTQKPGTQSRPLKLNFYEHPDRSHRVLADLLQAEGRNSIYVKAFLGAEIPSLELLNTIADHGERKRAERRILMYWAVLKKAGFDVNERALSDKLRFDPGYSQNLRSLIWKRQTPPRINSLSSLVEEFDMIAKFIREEPNHVALRSSGSGETLFRPDDQAILNFLNPSAGAGPAMIQRFRIYHDRNAGDFSKEIIKLLDEGFTVILDLSNANPEVMNYFSEELSAAVFVHQVDKFSNNQLENHFIQLYFEEAHNLFPLSGDVTTIYSRLAKEGAKYHIGMVYSTQSPTTINKDLLAQTENFFVAHLASQDDVNMLAKVNIAYESLKYDILQAKTVGYIRMLTRSHRFVVSFQARKFEPPNLNVKGK